MARKQVVTFDIIDSLTGQSLEEHDAKQVVVAVDGDQWILDLSKNSLDKLNAALDPFVKNEQKTRVPARLSAARGRTVPAAPKLSVEERRAVTEFARAKDLPPVSNKGRVRQSTVDAWEAAGRPMSS